MASEVRLRPGARADADELAAVVHEGFEGYRSFAHAGWDPPPFEPLRQEMRAKLGRPEVWCLVAEVDGAVAGHVAFNPPKGSRWPTAEPGLVHLWQLFVRPPFWGTGIAPDLLGRAHNEARARGFTTMRLFTPAGQTRARRFYEREGWRAVADPADGPDLGLPLVEYRRSLG